MWPAGEKIFEQPWCWLHIYWLGHLGFGLADSVHDERMGSRHGLSFTNIKLVETNVLLQYDGFATVNHPPSTQTFDHVNHKPSLHRHHSESAFTPAPSNVHGMSGGDLAHISQIISSMVSMAHGAPIPCITPTHSHSPMSASTPTWNTLLKLSHFLEYAKTHLNHDSMSRMHVYMKKVSEC